VSLDPVDLLLDEIVKDGRWPPKREVKVHAEIATWRAFLNSDREKLKVIANWTSSTRDYKVDPLGPLMCDTWADHLFGEEIEIEPGSAGDDKALTFLMDEAGDFTGDIHEAERQVCGLGEEWWRIYKDEEIADVPLVEWHDRDVVVPLYVGNGRRLLAAALVTELPAKPRSRAVYRHFEIHAAATVEHVLFRGSRGKIGQTVPLEDHPDLEDLARALPGGAGTTQARVWNHGLPMLMGPVTNGRLRDKMLGIGVSDFRRVSDQLLDLNEAATIGPENARLTAKRRVVVSEDSIRPSTPELVDRGDGTFTRVSRPPQFDAGEDVIVASRLDAELGQSADSTFKVLEYSFDAEPFIIYKRDQVETALTRCGITPQYVGLVTGQGDGFALSGTALRLRLIPTTKTGHGKARPWIGRGGALPLIVSLLAQVDALGTQDGGFGRSWRDPAALPAVTLANPLPPDEVEDAQVDASLVSARLLSRFTAIARRNPQWSDQDVAEEVARIDAESPQTSALFNPNLG
jgi:hypothetical protein